MFIKYYNEMFKSDEVHNPTHTGKQLLIYGYLFMNRTMRDEVNFSLEELIRGCGYVPDRHIGKTNDLFRSDLINMINKNKSGHFDIKSYTDIDKVNIKDRIILNLGDIMMGHENKHTKLNFCDFDIITASDFKSKENLLLTYLFLKSHFFERKSNDLKNIQEKPIGYAIDYDRISKELNLGSENTVIAIVDYLCDLNLLYRHITGGYRDKKGNIKNAPNVYTLPEYKSEVKYIVDNLKELYNVDRFFRKYQETEL